MLRRVYVNRLDASLLNEIPAVLLTYYRQSKTCMLDCHASYFKFGPRTAMAFGLKQA